MSLPPLNEIISNFDFLDEWSDRYRYIIELGRMLDPLPDSAKHEGTQIRGCASQAWLEVEVSPSDSDFILSFKADSDAHIVRGLLAVIISLYSGHTAQEIKQIDAIALFKKLDLLNHLTPQRANGVASVIERIQTISRQYISLKTIG